MVRTLILLGLIATTTWGSLKLVLAGTEIPLGNQQAARFLLESLGPHPRVLVSLGAQIAAILWLYAVWFAALWQVTRSAARVGHWSARVEIALPAAWAASAWVLLRMHSASFPNSLWTWALNPAFDQTASGAGDVLAVLVLAGILLRTAQNPSAPGWAGTAAGRRSNHPGRSRLAVWGVLAAAIPVIWTVNLFSSSVPAAAFNPSPAPGGNVTRPENVIIIGLDSLRSDAVLDARSWNMPNLAALVETGFLNQNVVTPLARTFPSWVTILTGKLPRSNGARTNHAPQRGVDHAASVAWTFVRQGYRTIYATDETRFSHIGPAFGFSEIVGPQMGVSDFLLGQFADQPLVNFAIQIPFAEHLFPALVGNRAFAHAYRPERFVARLSTAIGDADQRPAFLAIHLCSAHWPFYVAERKPRSADTANSTLDHASYRQMLEVLDRQLGLLLARLKALGYLNENSLLVLLADHGEGLPSDAVSQAPEIVSHGQYSGLSYPLGGHGGSLLAPEQWRVFTLFHGHGASGEIAAGRSTALASLEDVGPKLVELALPDAATGRTAADRLPALQSRAQVFMETGWRPKGFNALNPESATAFSIAESSYIVLPDGRIEMKPQVYEEAISDKELGVTDGDRTLVLMQSEGNNLLVEADHVTPRWDVYDASAPAAAGVEFAPLRAAACNDAEMSLRMSAWCPGNAAASTSRPR